MSFSSYNIYRWFWGSLDWLYPPTCAGCSLRGVRWCEDCEGKTRRILSPYCPTCGHPQSKAKLCQRCRDRQPSFEALRAWALFDGPVRSAIHRLKYNHDVALGELLGRRLIDLLGWANWDVDCVVPVPLSRKRQKERGYNQSALLARPIALHEKLEYLPGALERVKDTRSQIYLNEQARRINVKDAFSGARRHAGGRRILLIDDVSTTGSTLNACAAELVSAGASVVYCLTLAIADRQTQTSLPEFGGISTS